MRRETFQRPCGACCKQVGDEFVEIFGEGSHVLGDGPFVVVQNENELFGRAGDVVQGLERDSTSESGISGNGDHMFVSSFEVTGHASAQGCGQGGSGVSGSKGIMLTFFPRNESAQAFGLPDFVKALVVPAGQEFVNVSLVGNVPRKGIIRCVEYEMKGYGQFDHSKVWPHVPPFSEVVSMIRFLISPQSCSICSSFNSFKSEGHEMQGNISV